MGSLLGVCLVVATEDAFENTGSDILSRASGLHTVTEGKVRFFEGIKGNLNFVGSTGNVVLWAIRILDGEAVIFFWAAIDTIVRLLLLATQTKVGEAVGSFRSFYSDMGRLTFSMIAGGCIWMRLRDRSKSP